ncbi:MAG TPA: metallophosphoesterase [Phycisphaerales bacterium]|nr:metallophosphoesterase [Phycisphaerales bacterium]
MASAVDMRNAEAVIGLFERAAEAVRRCRWRVGSVVKLPASGRIVISGDLHDQPEHLRKIAEAGGLRAGSERHVVLQEVIHGERLMNGMDFSHRTLAKVAELVEGFPDQVHVVLANHELAQLTGRGVSKGAGNTVEQFSGALEYVFGDEYVSVEEAMKRFFRALPIAVRTESGILCSHSLPAPHEMAKFDFGLLERDLIDADYQPPSGAAHVMVWGRRHTAEQIETLSNQWGVKLFCVGHEHAEMGIEMRGPKHVVLNSDHSRGIVVEFDLAEEPTAEKAVERARPLVLLGGGGYE